MKWQEILKAGCGCGCSGDLTKSRGMSAAGRTGQKRRKPMRGSTLDSSSYLACIDRLAKLHGLGKINYQEYEEGRDKCKAKFGM